MYAHQFLNYSGTSLKRTLMEQKFLPASERCPPWRCLNWKVPKFKVRLFYTGPTLTRTPPPPYLTTGMWNGEKEVIFFCNVSVYLTAKVKVVSFCLFLIIMSCSFSVTISDGSFISPSSYCLVKQVIRSTNCSASEIDFIAKESSVVTSSSSFSISFDMG